MVSTDSYSRTIKTHAIPQEILDKISRIAEWWGTDFEGEANNTGATFTVRFKNGDRYKAQVAEIIPDKKVVWDIIDAYQTWVKEPTEWVGTKIVWTVDETSEGSELHFIHLGLKPTLECFNQCIMGWDYLILQSLSELLETGKGQPV